MVNVFGFMEEEARRRAAALRAGQGLVDLREGPKWICRIASEPADRQRWLGEQLPVEIESSLLRLNPANVILRDAKPWREGWLAVSATDDEGKYKGYVYAGPDRAIEMIGVLSVGVWADAARTWWPGTYEVPMARMLTATIRSLLDQLFRGSTGYLFMSLVDIEGTSIVAESEGIERPFSIPSGVDTIHFATVRLDDSPACHVALTAAFNRIRKIVGIEETVPFYL
jgi:hypothetical protein